MTVSQTEFLPFDDLRPLQPNDAPTSASWAASAARFHELNPHVYRALVRIARSVKARGLDHYGIGACFEVLRYQAIQTTGTPYKLNHNHRAWYARAIMRREPDLVGFFVTRGEP